MKMRPNRALSMARLSNWMGGLSRFCLTTKRCTPAASHACTSSSAPASEIAIGFSVKTWRPARAATMPCAGCSPDGVQMATTSLGTSSSISSSEPNAGTPRSAAVDVARARSLSATETSSNSGTLAIASRWFLLMRPQPTRATRTRCVAAIGKWAVMRRAPRWVR